MLAALILGSHLILGGSDCQITHTAPQDDGSMTAVCVDQSTWVYDADGQPYENAAGVPVREPGWYIVEGSN